MSVRVIGGDVADFRDWLDEISWIAEARSEQCNRKILCRTLSNQTWCSLSAPSAVEGAVGSEPFTPAATAAGDGPYVECIPMEETCTAYISQVLAASVHSLELAQLASQQIWVCAGLGARSSLGTSQPCIHYPVYLLAVRMSLVDGWCALQEQ